VITDMENLAGIRDSFGAAILDLAREDERIVALAADSKFSSKLDVLEKQLPGQFYEVGICEQNMVGVAAGLALSGKIPFVSAIACFMSMRCFEQIRTAVAYPKLNVKVVGMSSGFAYPQLGATHTCVEDVSIMRAASHMVVISPADNMEVYKATKAIAAFDGPVYMRLGRHPVPDIYGEDYEFVIGKGSTLRTGTDATIIAVGPAVQFALEACDMLHQEGIACRVINLSTIKPLDEELVAAAARETGGIVTVEEHNIAGGLGSAVAEFLVEKCPTRMKLIGIPNEVPPAAPRKVLLERYGICAAGIARAVRKFVR
jgi:transketolase